MKNILLRSVYDAFDYVMDHYFPAGMENEAPRKDAYAVISIQDTHTGGFGFTFQRSMSCRDVLTLYFDDIVRDVPGAVLFSREMAEEIIDFILKNRGVDTLLVHCYGGESRSRAVAAFASELLGGDGEEFFKTGHPNQVVYDTLKETLERRRRASGKVIVKKEENP
ncbi:MAG: hypothetical protein IKE57_03125 [Oscillospiraceae bacterium]|nr:hypothetical protein [Oscillospiraceae bacterium]